MEIQQLNEHQIQKDETNSLARIFQEFKQGFDFIRKFPKTVSILGSARFNPEHQYSKMAAELGSRIVKELDYAVVTGGGPGIMQAANKGAKDAGGKSLGVTIKLPKEQHTNEWVTDSIDCNYFFTRKTILTFAAEAYIVFPGGFGTFDEFFEVLTLIQTKKIPQVPIILIGTEFWNPLLAFIKQQVLEENHAIDEKDIELFTITDNLDEVLVLIKKAPIQRWWKHIEN